jgi:hypothetical protein
MNISEGLRRLALVIRWGSNALAAGWSLAVLATTYRDPVRFWLFAPSGAALILAIGHALSWVLLGFAGDREPPRAPGG